MSIWAHGIWATGTRKPEPCVREVEQAIADLKASHDPLAAHIFASRRQYRTVNDTKGGKRREVAARISYSAASELGFRGTLDEWERLMGAA